jgi:hypothetical protein
MKVRRLGTRQISNKRIFLLHLLLLLLLLEMVVVVVVEELVRRGVQVVEVEAEELVDPRLEVEWVEGIWDLYIRLRG